MYQNYIKRLLDIVLSGIALILLSPILLIVSILVRTKLGSPIIFKQERPGKDEKIFTMYKFRTMTDKTDSEGNLLPDSERLTKFGKLLRSTSLDELPELWNIFVGDMSIVGPRPQLVRDMLFMTDNQRKRHRVRPGLTGVAQINGRNLISWEKKLNYDLYYIENIKMMLDFKIILLTFKPVFIKRVGITSAQSDTSLDLGDHLLINKIVNEDEYLMRLKLEKKIINKYRKEK